MSTSLLYLFDYSGIEMRLISEASGEQELIDMFRNDPVNADPHTIAAELFYDKIFMDMDTCFKFFKINPKKDVENEYKKYRKILRSAAKNASFAKAYIAKLPKLLKTLMLTYEQAEPGYYRYRDRWPNVFYFSENIIKKVKEKGFIETPFGPYLYAIKDNEYILGNYLIQCIAAKILKRGIVRCHYYYKKAFNGEVKMILDVHDEIIVKFPRKFLSREKEFVDETKRQMCICPEVTVPLSVECKRTATTWNAAKELKI